MQHLTSKFRIIVRQLSVISKSSHLCPIDEDFMSYRNEGRRGGGGHSHYRGHGGPNRGGGRGRGGRGRGLGKGPPPGLSGREIGMYYAARSKRNKEEREKNSRAVVNIDRDAERSISEILSNVRQQSVASQTGTSDWSRKEETDPADFLGKMEYDNFASGPSALSDGSQAQPGLLNQQLGAGSPGSSQIGAGSLGLAHEYSKTLESWESDDFAVATVKMDDEGNDFTSRSSYPGKGDSLLRDKDQQLMDELLEARKSNDKYKKMLEFRQRLPSWKAQDELLQMIKSSQVTVISGETGCGKTTQVPQFILDDAIMSGWGSRCHVICTQPRRISALSVAQRVAAERGESLGHSAGFQIRLENTLPRTSGSILYCTTGILLRRLIGDPNLSEVSHVIMDEVHERSISSDFLAIIMKDLLVKRPDIKLILMSATLNAEMFSQYFNQAPMFKIDNVVFPVAEYFLEDILKITNYCPQSVKQSRPRPHWTRYGEGRKEHEKEMEEQRERVEYINSLEAKRIYPSSVIDTLKVFDEKDIDLNLVFTLVRYICTSQGEGAILIFLPGWDTITKLNDMLLANPVFRGSNYLIIPLHSMMPTAFQQKVFDRPPQGVRKIVIATNIAETSITIDDVVYVIDCGKVKETTYDATHQLACLDAVWVSKAAARQRRGRAGRVQPGQCFHMFSKFHHDKMAEFQQPEMLRTPLEELLLQIKILKLGMAFPFLQKAMEPPKEESVINAIQCLRDLNALTVDEELTPLGHHLANLPVNPRIGKIILFGAVFSCLDPVLTIASALGFKEPFVIPLHKQEEADAIKKKLAGDSRSDHIALLRAFQGWEEARHSGSARQYCWNNFLANNTLELLKSMKTQFAGLLYDTGFIPSSNPKDELVNVNSSNMKLVKAVLCAGLYPNVVKIAQNRPGSHPKLLTKDGKVKFHPKSVNCDETWFDSKYMIYHTKVKSTAVFIHDSSLIHPFPLLFFGGDISVQRDHDQDTIAVDGWIIFQASQHIAELVKEMRKQLDSVLQQKIARPRMKMYEPHDYSPSPSSQLIQAIIDLITREDYTDQAARLTSGKHLYVRGRR